MLSDIEECVLEKILLGERMSRKLAESCGITELTLNVVIERLVSKGYIDWDMNPTDKAYRELRWVNGVYPLDYYVDTKRYLRMVLELAIAVAFFILLASAIIYLR